MKSPLLMCKHCKITWNGEVLTQGNFVELMSFRAVDANQWFLFERNSPSERPSVNPWRRRQSECVAHVSRFGEKILRDWSETATLKVEIEAAPVREPNL